MKIYYSLYEHLLSQQRLYESFRHVKRNKGAAGIDGQSLSAFEANLEVELSCLLLELKEKRYRAQPVRRVAIAKDDGGERLLGISTVRDRVVHQALRGIIELDLRAGLPPVDTGTVRDTVVTTPLARRSCSFAVTGVTGLWTWTCRNASTR